MKTQLLCTFTINKSLRPTVDLIVDTYDVLFNKIFVLKSVDTSELMCTYNVDSSKPLTILDNTISLHRKKHTNTLYTINALNELIKSINNGVLDTNFQVDWDNYRNCLLATTENGLRKVNTEVKEIVHIKVKSS
jgi:hypothetical protein